MRRGIARTRRTGSADEPRLGRVVTPIQRLIESADVDGAVDRAMREFHVDNPDAWHGQRPWSARDECQFCEAVEANVITRQQRAIAEVARSAAAGVSDATEQIKAVLAEVAEMTATPSFKP